MRIFIGIPSSRNHQGFLKSMADFLPALGKEYEVRAIEVRNRKIDEARNFISEKFLESGFEYLLFLDDDHEGHTVEMLKHLISLDTYVSAIKCYSRYFAYLPNLLDYSGSTNEREKYKRKDINAGDHPCDLVGFGMTLIKREVFSILDKPYFLGEHNCREDNYFCDCLVKKGIRPIGCFDYCLSHDGITEEIAENKRNEGIRMIMESIEKNMGYIPKNLTLVS
jgi:hypothetical protein